MVFFQSAVPRTPRCLLSFGDVKAHMPQGLPFQHADPSLVGPSEHISPFVSLSYTSSTGALAPRADGLFRSLSAQHAPHTRPTVFHKNRPNKTSSGTGRAKLTGAINLGLWPVVGRSSWPN